MLWTVSIFLSPNSILTDRELSLLQFNRRVLEQAKDPGMPVLERLKFLCIAGIEPAGPGPSPSVSAHPE